MSATSALSLFGGSALATAAADARESSTRARTLLDSLYDGFFMLFQLHNGQQSTGVEDFLSHVHASLDDFDRDTKRLNMSIEDVFDARYASCAVVGKTILSSSFAIRPAWERRPLQLVLFGEQLAGETFFVKLEKLRAHGTPHLQALEVFHMCLLLDFRGKYILERLKKLAYLTARLSDEISVIRSKRVAFAPHWPLPDKVVHMLKRETSLWVSGAVFALVGLLDFLGLSHTLNAKTNEMLEGYSQVIKLGPRFSHLAISLSRWPRWAACPSFC